MRKKQLQKETEFIPTIQNTWKPVLVILVLTIGLSLGSAMVIDHAYTNELAMSGKNSVTREQVLRQKEEAKVKRNGQYQNAMPREKNGQNDKGYQWNLELPVVLRSPKAEGSGHVLLKMDKGHARPHEEVKAKMKTADEKGDPPTLEETAQLQPFAATFNLMRPEIRHNSGGMEPLIHDAATLRVVD